MSETTNFTEDGDDGHMSYRQIMDMLGTQKELILTISKDDIPALKRNLTALKSRDAAKLKNAGLDPADEVLSYTEIAIPGNDKDIRFHIRLGARKSILVKKVEAADDTL